MEKERRGGRVAEGAPLLRAKATPKDVKKKLDTSIRCTQTWLKRVTNWGGTHKSHNWSHHDDIYQTLIDVLDVRLREPIDDWSRDEFDELRETLVSMQGERRKYERFAQK